MIDACDENARKGQQILSGGRKRVLVVLFIPSVERDGMSTIDQTLCVALEMLGRVFGGATAFPKAKGIWRDDERDGTLIKDEPIVVHCYTTPADIENDRNLAAFGDFCRKLGRETRQGEVGLVWATSTSPSATLVKEQRDEDAAQHG